MKDVFKKIIRKIREGYLKEMWKEWKWIAKHFRRHVKGISFFLVSGIISTVLSLLSAVAGKYLIDAVTGHKSDKIVLCAALTVGLAVLSVLIMNGIGFVKVKIRTSVINEVQSKVYGDILDSEWLDVSRLRNGDLINRLNNDTEALATGVLEFLPSIVNNVISFIGALAIMLYFDPMMALIGLISAPVASVMSYSVIRKIRIFSMEMFKAQSSKMSFTEDTVSNLQTVKAFGISPYFEKKMQGYLEECRDITVENSAFMVRCQNILAIIGIIATYSCYCFGVYRMWGGMISYGTMTLFIDLTARLRAGFSSIVNIVPDMVRTGTRVERIIEIEGMKKEGGSGAVLPEGVLLPEGVDLSESIGLSEDVVLQKGVVLQGDDALSEGVLLPEGVDEIGLDGVCFSYVEGREILTNVSFSAKKGEIVALVGPSGEGKTTVVRLLLGMIHASSGRGYIKFNNKRYAISADTRKLFAYVPQGNTLFAGSIAENVRMVREDATDDEIVEALKCAKAWNFVSELDGGMNYIVGEHGAGLSEGQAQRISIARALIRNAPIILMDEATSALDPDTEEKILKHIMQADSDKIIIVTAHRKSVMEHCTKVFTVAKGKVVVK